MKMTQTQYDAYERRQGRIPAAAPPAKAKRKSKSGTKTSEWEIRLAGQLEALHCMEAFKREQRFHPVRRFRLDFLAKEFKLGAEIHGGIYTNGRHVRGKGFEDDRTKMNLAAAAGITVLEFTPAMVKDWSAAFQLLEMLRERGWRAS